MEGGFRKRMADAGYRLWVWLMGVFALDDGDEEYDDDDVWADWETEQL